MSYQSRSRSGFNTFPCEENSLNSDKRTLVCDALRLAFNTVALYACCLEVSGVAGAWRHRDLNKQQET